MNLTQWLLVATPVLVAYVLFVFFAESDGKRNIPAHAAGGLLVIPLILAMTPFILLSAGVDLLRSKRGPLVLEVNSSPGLEGIEGATKVDIAGKIIQYLEKNAGKNRIQKDKINA